MKKVLQLSVVLAFFLSGCIYVNLPSIRPLTEKVIGGQGAEKILVIDISGVIKDRVRGRLTGLGAETNITARIKEELTRASEDKHVKALILRINSPGGYVTPSDIINHEIRGFKKRTGLPVVAQLMDRATSGAYYIAAASDTIVAQPTTVTGSIGVVAFNIDATGLMGKVGITNRTIKSGPLKDMASPLKEMTEQEIKILKSVIDELYERFLDVVSAGRKDLSDRIKLKEIADGRVYTATQALKLKLVDSIGYMDDSIDIAKKLAGLEEARIITYARPGAYRNNIYSMGLPSVPSTVNLINIDAGTLAAGLGVQFMYLWMP